MYKSWQELERGSEAMSVYWSCSGPEFLSRHPHQAPHGPWSLQIQRIVYPLLASMVLHSCANAPLHIYV